MLAAQRQWDDPFPTVFLVTLVVFLLSFVFYTFVFFALSLSLLPNPLPTFFHVVFGSLAVLFGFLSRMKWSQRKDAIRERKGMEALLEKEEGRLSLS